VVGGGPAGAVLSLLLARAGIPVTLLEAHKDFDRDFRGDTVHASVLEVMDQIGLADRVLELAHARLDKVRVYTAEGVFVLEDLSRLKTRFPFATMLPQAKFLDFLITEARRYPGFRLVMGANVQRLVVEQGEIRGVRYRDPDGAWHEVRALLTVGADGRFSKVRSLAGLELEHISPEIDVLWFRLPRKPEDFDDAGAGFVGPGRVLILLKRPEQWQVGVLFPKGTFQQIRAAGLDALKKDLVKMVPWFADRVDTLKDWRQILLLSIQSGRLPQWHKPGLLLIGDAAHTMSPVCAVGINYAIQDAVVAMNVLRGPLKAGRVDVKDLAEVQRQRKWPIRVVQTAQAIVQKRLLASMTSTQDATPWKPSLGVKILRGLPYLRDLPARIIHLGLWRVRLQE
jgi:2-polyprenyl-6-methoxyphenol hydroxylase-like FAD-dependent oxidoreductase